MSLHLQEESVPVAASLCQATIDRPLSPAAVTVPFQGLIVSMQSRFDGGSIYMSRYRNAELQNMRRPSDEAVDRQASRRVDRQRV